MDQPLGGFGLLGVEGEELNAQHAAGFPRGLDHGLAVQVGAGDGLFAVDVLAGLEGGDGDGGVEVVVEADVNGLDFLHREQLAEVGE